MPVSYPDVLYGEASNINVTPRLNKIKFGDTYQQTVPDGINFQPRSGILVHPLLPLEDNTKTVGANTMRAFLNTYMDGSIVTIINYMEDPTGGTTLNVFLTKSSAKYKGLTTTFTVLYEEAFGV